MYFEIIIIKTQYTPKDKFFVCFTNLIPCVMLLYASNLLKNKFSSEKLFDFYGLVSWFYFNVMDK